MSLQRLPASWSEEEVARAEEVRSWILQSVEEIRLTRARRRAGFPISLEIPFGERDLVRRLFPVERKGYGESVCYVGKAKVLIREGREVVRRRDRWSVTWYDVRLNQIFAPAGIVGGAREVYTQLRRDGAAEERAAELCQMV